MEQGVEEKIEELPSGEAERVFEDAVQKLGRLTLLGGVSTQKIRTPLFDLYYALFRKLVVQEFERLMMSRGESAKKIDESLSTAYDKLIKEIHVQKLGHLTISKDESAEKMFESLSLACDKLLIELATRNSEERLHSHKHGNKICITTDRL